MESHVMARIVFDLDGTLIDSAPDIHGIANDILQSEGKAPITLAEARDFIGNGSDVFVTRMRNARELSKADHDRLHESFLDRYLDAVSLTTPYPGVVEALGTLQSQGHHLGICTNKPIRPCMAVLKHLELDKFFLTVKGGDSLPVHKPDPAPLNAAFEALPLGAEIFVGDSDVDAETGQRAFVPFLLYTEGYRKRPVGAIPHTAAFSHFDELPGLITKLLADAA